MTDRPSHRTDLDFAESHLQALYTCDARGRLTGRASPGDGPAPRFHLVRTKLGAVWRFAADLPDAVVRELARFAALEPGCEIDGTLPPTPPDRLEPMRRAIESVTRLDLVAGGPAYHMPEPSERAASPWAGASSVDVATEASDARLGAWASDLGERADALRAGLPVAVSSFEGRVVSCCRVARGDPARVVEAGVETHPSARGRGHAAPCVAAWARAVEAMGGLPLYSTAWSNRASRRVAAKLGLVAYAEDWHFR